MSNSHMGHQARKRFGQNFLHDPNVIRNIVKSIRPKVGDNMVEIGPGMGAITEELLEATEGHLNVVELDRDLIPGLNVKFFNHAGFKIHEADALKFDFQTLKTDERQLRIVGNLPYNISTPLIFHLLSYSGTVKDMHFMLQKEVVDRMAAGPNTKAYGRLSIMTQYQCQVMPVMEIGPEAFKPAPKVDSAIVRLIPHKSIQNPVRSLEDLNHVCVTAFNQRRKTIRNSFKKLIDEQTLIDNGIDPTLRPENLSIDQYILLANVYTEQKSATNDA